MQRVNFAVGGLPLPDHVPISLGPRHPTSAGTITIAADVDDDIIIDADVQSGYGHRAAEKLFEVRDYRAMIMLADRHDWLAAFSGELSLTLTLENAMRLSPTPRATILRTLLAELARIHSHLSFLSYIADGDLNLRVWGCVESIRQHQLSLTGNRVHPMINRVGGLSNDADETWLDSLDPLLDDVSRVASDLRGALATDARFTGLAVVDEETCLGYGLSGPVARAAGLDLDRRAHGYLAYDRLHRPVQTRTAGDAAARFGVLVDELGTSVDMIRMARAAVQETPGEVAVRLSRRLKVPEGEHTVEIEAPWGIASCLMVSRGGQTPWRVALRTPSFSNLSVLGLALRGVRVGQIADVVASLGYTIGDADK